MNDQVQVLGISGSLRRGSYNTAALRAAQELMPDGMTLRIFDLSGVPFFNEDVESTGIPESVRQFTEAIEGAGALLIASPEYNYSYSGVLKNALDWASRAPGEPLDGKPVAIMGASQGQHGTVRGQLHLRQVLHYTNSLVLSKPEVLIGRAQEKFDEQGRLLDEASRQQIRKQLEALRRLTYMANATSWGLRTVSTTASQAASPGVAAHM